MAACAKLVAARYAMAPPETSKIAVNRPPSTQAGYGRGGGKLSVRHKAQSPSGPAASPCLAQRRPGPNDGGDSDPIRGPYNETRKRATTRPSATRSSLGHGYGERLHLGGYIR